MVGPFQDDSYDGETDLDARTWGNSSTNFRWGGCMWCHPGGGPMEYDRDGYRYDGLGAAGANPNKALEDAQAGVPVVDSAGNVLTTNPDGIRYGDYWVFDAATDGLVSKAGATAKGVAEVDCLMCHLSNMTHASGKSGAAYNNQDRDFCSSKPGTLNFAPGNGATMGLTLTGEVLTTQVSDATGHASCDVTGYEDGILEATDIVGVPTKEACALCHFPDATKPKGLGPGNTALDFTTFQKHIPAGDFTDSDVLDAGLAGRTTNALAYDANKGRAEFGKRGLSINDAGNPDAHMDAGLTCSDCHYALEGDFEAYTHDVDGDGTEEVIQVAKTGMTAMDHNFAKGNNRPDGKNSDQLDNTITCEACHIPGTPYGNKPGSVDNGDGTMSIPLANGTTAQAPIPTHTAFPAVHIDRIDCRTCHIPEMNFVKKQQLADFSTTPYPLDYDATKMNMGGFARAQNIAKKVDGTPQRIHYKPLYSWQDRGHGGGDYKLTPVVLGAAAVWKDLASGQPYAMRMAGKAAKQTRGALGDADNDGIADFPLNNPDNGDTALIANTTEEIAMMVSKIKGLGKQSLEEPALNIFINTFSVSHNVAASSNALGSPENGGCVVCHSTESVLFNNAPIDTDPDSPCFGQPEGCQGLVFFQPKDGSVGLEMTCDGGDCSTGTKRVVGGVGFTCPDGTKRSFNVDADTHGAAVSNVIPQEKVLCYDEARLADLRRDSASAAYFDAFWVSFTAAQSDSVSMQLDFDGSASVCGDYVCDGTSNTCIGGLNNGGACTSNADCRPCDFAWDFNGDGIIDDNTSGAQASEVYGDTNVYTAVMTITDPATGYSKSTSKYVQAKELASTVELVSANASTGLTASITIAEPALAVDETLRSVYIDWRDRTQERLRTGGTYTHTYTRAGTYQVRVRVSTNLDNHYFFVPVTVTSP